MSWKVQIEHYLQGENLWHYTQEEKTSKELLDKTHYEGQQYKTLHILQMCVKPHLFPLFQNIHTPKQAWDLIAKKFAAST